MAYTFFPESSSEIKTKLKDFDKNKVQEIVEVFNYLNNKFKDIKTPINIDPKSISKINVTRQLQGAIELKEIKNVTKISKISMKFGSGSSGGRGVMNKGNAYEFLLAKAIEDWWNGEEVNDSNLLSTVEELSELLKLKECKNLKVETVGELNNRRPIVFSPSVKISSQISVVDNNLGPVVTDITLTTCNNKKIYLSLKTGGTVTFFNSGVRTVLTPSEIKSGKIKNTNGIKLLKMFNIDPSIFCDVFNGKMKKGIKEDVWKTMNSIQRNQLKDFLKSGIGHGFIIVHKLSSKTKIYTIDKNYMEKAASPKSCVVYYGGKTGTGKRIDMEIETGHYILKLNIRDTQGTDGYPTRMMCDYSYL